MAAATAYPAAPTEPPAPPRRGRWPLAVVIATTLAALIVAGAYVATRSASYEATTDVLVSPLAVDDTAFQGLPLIRESSDGSRPVQTATGLLSGPAVAAIAAKDLGDRSQSEVEGAVIVAPRGASNIVAITAKTDSADDAARIANSYARAGLSLRRHTLAPALEREIGLAGEAGDAERLSRLESAQENGDPTLSVTAPAQPPSGESTLSAKVILVVALIVGLLAGIAVVMIVNVSRAPALDSTRG